MQISITKKNYFVELESLRGIAAICVAIFHVRHWYFFKGYSSVENLKFFVDFFFVLSGFVITYNFLYSVKNTEEFKLFMVKRFFRLYPMFLFASIPFFIISLLKKYTGMNGFNAIPAFSSYDFFLYVTMIYKWGFVEGMPFNYPSWSISVELLLYVIAGLSFMKISRRKHYVYFYVFLAAVSFLILAASSNTLDVIGTFVPFRGILSFSIGSLVYFLFSSKELISARKKSPKAFLFTLTLVLLCVVFLYADKIPYLSYVFPLLWGFIIYLIVANYYPFILTQILKMKVVKEVGKVSYSYYLLHAIVISLVERFFHRSTLETNALTCMIALLVYLAVTFVLASLTYRFVEMPGKNLYRIWSRGAALKLVTSVKH